MPTVAANDRDWDAFADLLAEDVIYEGPQTRERFVMRVITSVSTRRVSMETGICESFGSWVKDDTRQAGSI